MSRNDPPLISVADAQARVLRDLLPVAAERVGIGEAWGRVLAAPVSARVAQPPEDVAAMDGYAVCCTEAGTTMRVIGEAAAGRPYGGAIRPGEAVRVFTGSVVPAGADAVALQELAVREGATVRLTEAPRPGQHIRRKGQDFSAGEAVLAAGTRLGARALGLAAAANYPSLAVHRRPVVAILGTGDEVAAPGEPIPAGGIVGSNGPMLAALVAACGGVPLMLPAAADSVAAIAGGAASASGADLLVTTGGASVGDHDLVRAGLDAAGFALDFWRVAMRPGKPMLSGRLGRTPVLGLPGNPVSAFVCALLFLKPALRVLGGECGEAEAAETARLGTPVAANDWRADHLRASLREGIATPFPRQDSAMLSVLADAGCLVLRPPHAPALPAGAEVPILRLSAGRE